MITLGHHPSVQRLLDEWKRSIHSNPSGKTTICSHEDLRRLIGSLEDGFDIAADQLDRIDQVSLRALFDLNWKWLRHRTERVSAFLQRLSARLRQ